VTLLTTDDAVRAVRRVLANKGEPATEVGVDSLLRDLGLDSLDLAEVLILLEDVVRGELEPASAGRLERVGDLSRLRVRDEAP
jgi:acyl carrier protein